MLPIQGNSRCIGHFSGPTIFSAAKLVRFWLIQESRTFAGCPLSVSSCLILSSSEPNLVLEQS